MKATELEQLVIGRLLADHELKPLRSAVNFDVVVVTDRELTGVGFLTEFERSEELKVFEAGVSLRWGSAGARLNASKIETGYLVYVDDGYITAVEGYTYGEDWPDQVQQIEIYKVEPGMELTSTLS
jgi:hypothetical protein